MLLYIYDEGIDGFQQMDVIPQTGQIRQISRGISPSEYLILSETGCLYNIKLHTSIYQIPFRNEKIKALTTNSTMALAITYSGVLYSFGEDAMHYGLLGCPKVYEVGLPMKIGYNFKKVSLSEQLAIGLDCSGRLYIWGNTPLGRLESPRVIPTNLKITLIQAAKDYAFLVDSMGILFMLCDSFRAQQPYNESLMFVQVKQIDSEHVVITEILPGDKFSFAISSTSQLYSIVNIGSIWQMRKVQIKMKIHNAIQTENFLYGFTEDNSHFIRIDKNSLVVNLKQEIHRISDQTTSLTALEIDQFASIMPIQAIKNSNAHVQGFLVDPFHFKQLTGFACRQRQNEISEAIVDNRKSQDLKLSRISQASKINTPLRLQNQYTPNKNAYKPSTYFSPPLPPRSSYDTNKYRSQVRNLVNTPQVESQSFLQKKAKTITSPEMSSPSKSFVRFTPHSPKLSPSKKRTYNLISQLIQDIQQTIDHKVELQIVLPNFEQYTNRRSSSVNADDIKSLIKGVGSRTQSQEKDRIQEVIQRDTDFDFEILKQVKEVRGKLENYSRQSKQQSKQQVSASSLFNSEDINKANKKSIIQEISMYQANDGDNQLQSVNYEQGIDQEQDYGRGSVQKTYSNKKEENKQLQQDPESQSKQQSQQIVTISETNDQSIMFNQLQSPNRTQSTTIEKEIKQQQILQGFQKQGIRVIQKSILNILRNTLQDYFQLLKAWKPAFYIEEDVIEKDFKTGQLVAKKIRRKYDGESIETGENLNQLVGNNQTIRSRRIVRGEIQLNEDLNKFVNVNHKWEQQLKLQQGLNLKQKQLICKQIGSILDVQIKTTLRNAYQKLREEVKNPKVQFIEEEIQYTDQKTGNIVRKIIRRELNTDEQFQGSLGENLREFAKDGAIVISRNLCDQNKTESKDWVINDDGTFEQKISETKGPSIKQKQSCIKVLMKILNPFIAQTLGEAILNIQQHNTKQTQFIEEEIQYVDKISGNIVRKVIRRPLNDDEEYQGALGENLREFGTDGVIIISRKVCDQKAINNDQTNDWIVKDDGTLEITKSETKGLSLKQKQLCIKTIFEALQVMMTQQMNSHFFNLKEWQPTYYIEEYVVEKDFKTGELVMKKIRRKFDGQQLITGENLNELAGDNQTIRSRKLVKADYQADPFSSKLELQDSQSEQILEVQQGLNLKQKQSLMKQILLMLEKKVQLLFLLGFEQLQEKLRFEKYKQNIVYLEQIYQNRVSSYQFEFINILRDFSKNRQRYIEEEIQYVDQKTGSIVRKVIRRPINEDEELQGSLGENLREFAKDGGIILSRKLCDKQIHNDTQSKDWIVNQDGTLEAKISETKGTSIKSKQLSIKTLVKTLNPLVISELREAFNILEQYNTYQVQYIEEEIQYVDQKTGNIVRKVIRRPINSDEEFQGDLGENLREFTKDGGIVLSRKICDQKIINQQTKESKDWITNQDGTFEIKVSETKGPNIKQKQLSIKSLIKNISPFTDPILREAFGLIKQIKQVIFIEEEIQYVDQKTGNIMRKVIRRQIDDEEEFNGAVGENLREFAKDGGIILSRKILDQKIVNQQSQESKDWIANQDGTFEIQVSERKGPSIKQKQLSMKTMVKIMNSYVTPILAETLLNIKQHNTKQVQFIEEEIQYVDQKTGNIVRKVIRRQLNDDEEYQGTTGENLREFANDGVIIISRKICKQNTIGDQVKDWVQNQDGTLEVKLSEQKGPSLKQRQGVIKSILNFLNTLMTQKLREAIIMIQQHISQQIQYIEEEIQYIDQKTGNIVRKIIRRELNSDEQFKGSLGENLREFAKDGAIVISRKLCDQNKIESKDWVINEDGTFEYKISETKGPSIKQKQSCIKVLMKILNPFIAQTLGEALLNIQQHNTKQTQFIEEEIQYVDKISGNIVRKVIRRPLNDDEEYQGALGENLREFGTDGVIIISRKVCDQKAINNNQTNDWIVKDDGTLEITKSETKGLSLKQKQLCIKTIVKTLQFMIIQQMKSHFLILKEWQPTYYIEEYVVEKDFKTGELVMKKIQRKFDGQQLITGENLNELAGDNQTIRSRKLVKADYQADPFSSKLELQNSQSEQILEVQQGLNLKQKQSLMKQILLMLEKKVELLFLLGFEQLQEKLRFEKYKQNIIYLGQIYQNRVSSYQFEFINILRDLSKNKQRYIEEEIQYVDQKTGIIVRKVIRRPINEDEELQGSLGENLREFAKDGGIILSRKLCDKQIHNDTQSNDWIVNQDGTLEAKISETKGTSIKSKQLSIKTLVKTLNPLVISELREAFNILEQYNTQQVQYIEEEIQYVDQKTGNIVRKVIRRPINSDEEFQGDLGENLREFTKDGSIVLSRKICDQIIINDQSKNWITNQDGTLEIKISETKGISLKQKQLSLKTLIQIINPLVLSALREAFQITQQYNTSQIQFIEEEIQYVDQKTGNIVRKVIRRPLNDNEEFNGALGENLREFGNDGVIIISRKICNQSPITDQAKDWVENDDGTLEIKLFETKGPSLKQRQLCIKNLVKVLNPLVTMTLAEGLGSISQTKFSSIINQQSSKQSQSSQKQSKSITCKKYEQLLKSNQNLTEQMQLLVEQKLRESLYIIQSAIQNHLVQYIEEERLVRNPITMEDEIIIVKLPYDSSNKGLVIGKRLKEQDNQGNIIMSRRIVSPQDPDYNPYQYIEEIVEVLNPKTGQVEIFQVQKQVNICDIQTGSDLNEIQPNGFNVKSRRTINQFEISDQPLKKLNIAQNIKVSQLFKRKSMQQIDEDSQEMRDSQYRSIEGMNLDLMSEKKQRSVYVEEEVLVKNPQTGKYDRKLIRRIVDQRDVVYGSELNEASDDIIVLSRKPVDNATSQDLVKQGFIEMNGVLQKIIAKNESAQMICEIQKVLNISENTFKKYKIIRQQKQEQLTYSANLSEPQKDGSIILMRESIPAVSFQFLLNDGFTKRKDGAYQKLLEEGEIEVRLKVQVPNSTKNSDNKRQDSDLKRTFSSQELNLQDFQSFGKINRISPTDLEIGIFDQKAQLCDQFRFDDGAIVNRTNYSDISETDKMFLKSLDRKETKKSKNSNSQNLPDEQRLRAGSERNNKSSSSKFSDSFNQDPFSRQSSVKHKQMAIKVIKRIANIMIINKMNEAFRKIQTKTQLINNTEEACRILSRIIYRNPYQQIGYFLLTKSKNVAPIEFKEDDIKKYNQMLTENRVMHMNASGMVELDEQSEPVELADTPTKIIERNARQQEMINNLMNQKETHSPALSINLQQPKNNELQAQNFTRQEKNSKTVNLTPQTSASKLQVKQHQTPQVVRTQQIKSQTFKAQTSPPVLQKQKTMKPVSQFSPQIGQLKRQDSGSQFSQKSVTEKSGTQKSGTIDLPISLASGNQSQNISQLSVPQKQQSQMSLVQQQKQKIAEKFQKMGSSLSSSTFKPSKK